MTGTAHGRSAQLLVMAKNPVPGRVKTRLEPRFGPDRAAELARAALLDTLDAAFAAEVSRRTLIFDSERPGWLPAGFGCLGQRGGGLDERLAHAFDDAYQAHPSAMVLIGGDTPQIRPEHIASAVEALCDGVDAVIGMAADGGYWLLGLQKPDPGDLVGVTMSTPTTGATQLVRLRQRSRRVVCLPTTLTDVDTAVDAFAVADQAPGTRFAAAPSPTRSRPRRDGDNLGSGRRRGVDGCAGQFVRRNPDAPGRPRPVPPRHPPPGRAQRRPRRRL